MAGFFKVSILKRGLENFSIPVLIDNDPITGKDIVVVDTESGKKFVPIDDFDGDLNGVLDQRESKKIIAIDKKQKDNEKSDKFVEDFVPENKKSDSSETVKRVSTLDQLSGFSDFEITLGKRYVATFERGFVSEKLKQHENKNLSGFGYRIKIDDVIISDTTVKIWFTVFDTSEQNSTPNRVDRLAFVTGAIVIGIIVLVVGVGLWSLLDKIEESPTVRSVAKTGSLFISLIFLGIGFFVLKKVF